MIRRRENTGERDRRTALLATATARIAPAGVPFHAAFTWPLSLSPSVPGSHHAAATGHGTFNFLLTRLASYPSLACVRSGTRVMGARVANRNGNPTESQNLYACRLAFRCSSRARRVAACFRLLAPGRRGSSGLGRVRRNGSAVAGRNEQWRWW